MRQLVLAAIFAASTAAFAQSQHWVGPYVDRNGNFIQGHWQTNPDGNVFNNWSTQGNVNPYTGQQGTVNPYQQQIRPIMPAIQPIQPPHIPRCGWLNGQYICI